MKKHFAILLVLLLTATSFAGCLDDDSSDNGDDTPANTVTIEITSPRNRASVDGVVDIKVATEDGNTVLFYIDGVKLQTSTDTLYQWDTTGFDNGEYSIKVEATSGDVEAEDSIKVNVLNRENEAPTLEITRDSEDRTLLAGEATLEFELSDIENDPLDIFVQFDTDGWDKMVTGFEGGLWGYQMDTTALEDGEHILAVKAADLEGESEPLEHEFTADNSAPLVNMDAIPTLLAGEMTLTVQIQDLSPVPSIAFFMDDDLLKNGSSPGYKLDTTQYGSGVHSLKVAAMDSLDNYGRVSKDIIIDNEAPNVYFKSDVYSGQVLNSPVTVEMGWHDISDVSYFAFYLEGWGEPVQEGSKSSWNFDPAYWIDEGVISEGEEFQLRGLAEDVAGNQGDFDIDIFVDLTNPSLEFSDLADEDSVAGDQEITVHAEDDETGVVAVQFHIDGELVEETSTNVYGDYTHQWNTRELADGSHDIEVVAADSGENLESREIEVTVDNTNPTVNINSPQDNDLINGEYDIEVTGNDNLGIDVLRCYIDDVELDSEDGKGETSIHANFDLDTQTLDDGKHELFVELFDLAGNVATHTLDFRVDNTDPEIRGHRPADGGKIRDMAELSVDARDENGITNYWFYLDDELIYSGSEDNTELDTTEYDDEEYELRFEVEDGAGNTAEKTITVTIDNVNPLAVTIVTPADSSYVKETVQVDVDIEDDEGEVQFVSFFVDDIELKNSTDEYFDWNTNTYSNDWHTLRVECGDDAGYFNDAQVEVFVDNIDPFADINNPKDNDLLRGMVLVDVDADDHESGVDAVAFYVDGEEVQDSAATSFNWNTSTGDDGDHELKVIVTDRAGNADEDIITVTVDNTPPELELLSPEKEYLRGWVDIEVDIVEEGSGLAYVDFRIKNESYQNSTQDNYRWDTTQEDDGPEYHIEIAVEDRAGNFANVTKTVLVDNTKPVVEFTNPEDQEAIAGEFLVETSITEKGSGRDHAIFYIDDEEVRNSTATTYLWDTTAFDDGRYEIKVEVFDKAGNMGETEIEVEIDNTNPTVSITSPGDGEKLVGSETLRADASDSGSGVWKVEFFLGGSLVREDAAAPYTATINADDYPDGEYELLVIARDYAKNFERDTITVFIGDDAVPVVANPYTNFLSPYADVAGKERLAFTDHRAVPVVSSLITNQGVTPSVGWDGTENPKQTADISFTDYSRFSGNIALNYWAGADNPDKSIVVEGYREALLMSPYASIMNYPIFIYTKQFTDEAIWKMNTVYANEIVTCGNTGYNNKGVTVVAEKDVVQFTINAAKSQGIELEYLSVVNPDDTPAISNTGYLSSYGAAFANVHRGVVILVRTNTNEINTAIHDTDAIFANSDMPLKHIAIVGDHKSVPMIVQSGTPSDNSYADFDGNRFTIERSLGRIFALELKDISYYFDRVANYEDYWSLQPIPPGVRGSPYMLPPFWNDNALIYCGVAAEFAEDSENHCREYMRFIGQFNTQDDSDKAHGAGAGPAIMQDFTMANFILINADHGYPAGTVTWDNGDILPLNPGISFAVSCSLGRVDGQNKGNTVTYRILEQGINVYMAPTRTAYGMLVQTYPYQPAAAPGLCYLYTTLIIDNDYDSGVAYMHAKNDLINNGYAGNVDQTTTWQYQHYGDPAFNPYEPNNEGSIF